MYDKKFESSIFDEEEVTDSETYCLWKEYEKRHQISNAYSSRGSSPASSHEIASENPLPIHVKHAHAQAVENQWQDRTIRIRFEKS